jgi:hypothetical protein
MTVDQLIQYLVTGGAVVVASWAASWGLEEFAWWAALPAKAKQFSILGASAVLACLGQFLLSRPDIVALIAPYLQAVILTVAAWLGTQTAHRNRAK